MSKEIDSSKSLLIDAYFFYLQIKVKVESYKDKIESGQYLLNLIYNNISDPYIQSYFGAKCYITFLDDYDKTLKVILFFEKNGVLIAFDLFQKRNKHKKNCI